MKMQVKRRPYSVMFSRLFFDSQERRETRSPGLRLKSARNNRCQATGIILLTFVVLALLPAIALSANVEGRIINWSMPAPDGWMGGNFYQIESYIQQTGNSNLRNILRVAQNSAMNAEAALIHFEDAFLAAKNDPSFSTRTLTEIVVYYLPENGSWSNLSQNFKSGLLQEYGQGEIEVVSERLIQFGNRTGHEAIFIIKPGGTGSLYKTLIMLPVSTGGWLAFHLTVDSSRHMQRLATLKQMLQSLNMNDG
jgi:hypothetical protein